MNKDITIVITAHSESTLLHRTLKSVLRGTRPLDERHIKWEILIHLDNPSEETLHYVRSNEGFLKHFRIYYNAFGSPSISRNFAVSKAKGTYVTLIDGDDLIDEHWLSDSYSTLESLPYGEYVAHTEMTVEFGDFNSIVQKYGETDKSTDTLLSVWSGRWNVNIMALHSLLLDNPYPVNGSGFGYEDWYLSCNFIDQGIHNILIPRTVLFVRRKAAGSTWSSERLTRSVLRANSLFSFSNFRKLTLNTDSAEGVQLPPPTLAQRVKHVVRPVVLKLPAGEKYAGKAYTLLREMKHRRQRATPAASQVPQWLIKEWKDIHAIEKELFPDPALLQNTPIYHTITPDHYRVGEAYWQMIQHTQRDTYDYILFVPWLVEGGADMFAINYANYAAGLYPGKHVLVIATNPRGHSPWRHKLTETVDFIPFGTIAGSLPLDQQYRLLEQLVENSHARVLHILNSALGYDFIDSHQAYIKGSGKKVIVTSYSQSTDESSRVFGFSHTHVPRVYDLADYITSDNQAVIDMWQTEYGFDPAKLLLHHQPFDFPEVLPAKDKDPAHAIHILWAARLAPEKMPELVGEIGKLMGMHASIDMYGTPSKGFDSSLLQHLPPNVTYKGRFDGLYTLPLQDYDAFLYTSLFDGTPNTLLEVAGAGLPIVSSAVGGIPDLIDDGKDGLLVKDTHDASQYAAALHRLQDDPKLRQKLSRHFAAKVHKDFSRSQFEDAINAMLSKVSY